MKLNIQKANLDLTLGFFEIMEEMGLQKLNMQSKADIIMEHVDRLPHLFQWLRKSLEVEDSFIQTLNQDRDELYDEEQEHSQFHIAMEFFWIIERVSVAVMDKILIEEPVRIAISSPELFNLWQSRFTEIPGIIPAKNCTEMLSLGQSYSVSGFRRISRLPKTAHPTLANLSIGELSYPSIEFKNMADATLPATIIHANQHQWVFDHFEEFEEQCCHTIGIIHDQLRILGEHENILFWLVDDDLNDRAMENFVLDEASETEATQPATTH